MAHVLPESRRCPGNKAILLDTQCLPVPCGLPPCMTGPDRAASQGESLQRAYPPQIQSTLPQWPCCTGCAKGKQN